MTLEDANRKQVSLPADYFEALYGASPDPWNFRASAYEKEKYASTLGALGREHYAEALEIGCSIGVSTRLLAARCNRLVAIDASATALARAMEACADLDRVEFRRMTLPADFPEGKFDLILLSEVVYYLVPADVRVLAAACVAALRPEGEILLCHWLGETDYPLSGDAASEIFIDAVAGDLSVLRQTRHEAYRLDLLGHRMID